ncbi:PAS domain-containing protein [Streptomyces sp. S1A(2023)]
MSSRPSRGTARLAAILDALPDGLLLVNCNGTVVNANAIALEMFETPGTALVGRGLLDLLPEFDSKLIPGSMRRPEAADEQGRTKPTRMTARRTDGHEYPVEVTSANVDSGQAAYNDIHSSYTGDELLMLVVRDLSGTVDTEAELARSQRQTEMILRAASEGVVGTDTDGRVVLVNPAAAQILGFRASDLGGQELHPLILHSRAEGEPFPYEDSPLADTLKSGRKHRVRGQVLWSKSGAQVPVDLTTAPVRDGDQLVGAVMTFTDRRPYEELSAQHRSVVAELTTSHSAEVTALKEAHAAELAALKEAHTAELADRSERYAAEIEGQAELLASLGAQHSQLTAVLGGSLRGPLEELRGELSTLASDPAGQLWARGQPDPAPPRRRVRTDDHARRQRAGVPAPGRGGGGAAQGPGDGGRHRHGRYRRGGRADRSRARPVRRARPADRGRGRRTPARDRHRPPRRGRLRRRFDRQDPGRARGRLCRLHRGRGRGPAR